MQSPVIEELMAALKQLPTIGPKSAQRLAYYLLQQPSHTGERLAQAIEQALTKVGRCERCRTLTEWPVCEICQDTRRDPSQLCVVESPTDIVVIEQSGIFHGYYFVLMGHLSPIDGIGPEDIGLPQLQARLQAGEIQEVILATNPTVEGEATAHYIQQLSDRLNVSVTRLAQGIPFGGELEYIDSGTLGQAFLGRKALD
ncbi:recombination mediator RecR [Thiomicrospira sp. WB1]|uniref:recombination mediator RecR n=1 Tax=Thiomicrospira sp. WB1 TaxID=1685380 RepID=UPI000747AB39|nr:recombination mediator RecR [Thiomicrospira sp. WB1]KUJ71504.1 recombination protein RecR [Thiomicrospira sp. WB1]